MCLKNFWLPKYLKFVNEVCKITGVPDTLTPSCPAINFDGSNFSAKKKKIISFFRLKIRNSNSIENLCHESKQSYKQTNILFYNCSQVSYFKYHNVSDTHLHTSTTHLINCISLIEADQIEWYLQKHILKYNLQT